MILLSNGKLWTDEEEEIIGDNWGRYSVDFISKKLGRTERAVIAKGYALGLGPRKDAQGKLTMPVLAKICSVSANTVKTWTEKGLKFKKTAIKANDKSRIITIKIDDFWKFAEKNKELINFAKIERLMLMPEPKWFREEREKDKRKIPSRHKEIWNKYEENRLVAYIKMGFNNEEIAIKMNRTTMAIKRRKTSIEKKKNGLKTREQKKWTEIETKKLIKLKEKGLCNKEIGKKLNRSRASVEGKYKALRGKK